VPIATRRQKGRKRFCYARVRHSRWARPSPTSSVSVPELHRAVVRGRGDAGGQRRAPREEDARGRGLEVPSVLAQPAPCLPQVPQLQGNRQRAELGPCCCHAPTRSWFTRKGRGFRLQSSSPLSPARAHSPGELRAPQDFSPWVTEHTR